MTFRKIILSLFVTLSMAAHAQARLPTEKQPSASASIFELPPFERAICCIRFYEGLHRAKDYPYVGYGHKLRPGERYSSNMSANEAEQLLRKDLKELCAMFRSYGQDSLFLSEISDNSNVSLPKVSSAKMNKLDREKTVINLYVAGHPIDDIWRASGFKSRSSVFRILNKHGIKLNRGNHSGPIKKRAEQTPKQDIGE